MLARHRFRSGDRRERRQRALLEGPKRSFEPRRNNLDWLYRSEVSLRT